MAESVVDRRCARGHGPVRRPWRREGTTVHELLIEVAPRRIRAAALELEASEARDHRDATTSMRSFATRRRSPTTPMRAATSTRRSGTSARSRRLGVPFERARFRELTTLSGGEQKRLVLEALLRGPDEVLLLDEPDNYLDVPGKRWLEKQLQATPKTVLLVSHDRELLARAADRIVTLETRSGRQHGVGARRQLRDVPRGADRPDGPPRRTAPALGRTARQAQGARRGAQGEGRRRATSSLRATALHRPGWRSSKRPGRPRSDRPSKICSCGCAEPARASARSSARDARAHRAHEAVRPRGLVRGPRRGARARTDRESPTSCASSPEAAPTPTLASVT